MNLKQKNSNNHSLPNRLLHIKHPPKEIFHQGDISLIDSHRNIAVIGSRKVSDKGIKLAFDTGYRLAKMGINVVNGLALGCDTYALKGALAAGGKCIAVMPCGLDQIVPKSNFKLARDILEKGGCLISEYPYGTEIEKYMYVERDRLQSEISEGIIVIEAGLNSGTMHTVRAAKRQGKPVGCYRTAEIASIDSSFNIIDDNNSLEIFVNNIFNVEKYYQLHIDDIIL